jgi:protein-disulfide isomerase
MTRLPLIALTAALLATTAACGKKAEDSAASVNTPLPASATPVAAPYNGDWSTMVSETPEGGFVMGNPAAKVKIVEFGSMSCPHCREFDVEGMSPLIEDYVKKGLASFEFRNYVRDRYDITAALIARCGGAASFFGLTRALYQDQPNWIEAMIKLPQAEVEALDAMTAQQQFAKLAEAGNFPAFASMRGLPRAKAQACLADTAAANRLVQMASDATTQFDINQTPSFLINGEKVEFAQQPTLWVQLKGRINQALGG